MEEESGDRLAPILRDADELSRRRSSTRPTCFFATVAAPCRGASGPTVLSHGQRARHPPVSAANSSITYGYRAATRNALREIHWTFSFPFSGLAGPFRCWYSWHR